MCMYVSMYACLHACMCVYIYLCVYVMHVCMYVSMNVYIHASSLHTTTLSIMKKHSVSDSRRTTCKTYTSIIDVCINIHVCIDMSNHTCMQGKKLLAKTSTVCATGPLGTRGSRSASCVLSGMRRLPGDMVALQYHSM